jgi:hypothetical protein
VNQDEKTALRGFMVKAIAALGRYIESGEIDMMGCWPLQGQICLEAGITQGERKIETKRSLDKLTILQVRDVDGMVRVVVDSMVATINRSIEAHAERELGRS